MSRAERRTGVRRVSALLAVALTQLLGGQTLVAQTIPASGSTSARTASGQPAGSSSKAAADHRLARSKLLQARTLLSQGNIDFAEAVARDVAKMSVRWSSSEDNPARVLQDISKARTDPHLLLKASRVALGHKEFALAESYARQAEKHSGLFTFPVWSDSPAAVLKEIQVARSKAGVGVGSSGTQTVLTTPAGTNRSNPYRSTRPSMPVVTSTGGYANAMNPNAYQSTRPSAPQVVSNVPIPVEEPSVMPKTIVEHEPVGSKPTSVVTTPTTTPTPKRQPTIVVQKERTGTRTPTTTVKNVNESQEARQLIKQSRLAYSAGKLDEARRLANLARTRKANLGWFEDNPDRIEADIRLQEEKLKKTARPNIVLVKGEEKSKTAPKTTAQPTSPNTSGIPRNKEEARMQLALGRKQLAEGKLDDAARTAQRIKSLTTVSWGLFEDSPDRLAVEISKARVARDQKESIQLLVEGRKLYEKGDYEGATRLAYRAQKLHGPYSIWDLGDRPTRLLGDIQTAQARARKSALPPPVVVRNDGKTKQTPPVPTIKPTPTEIVKNTTPPKGTGTGNTTPTTIPVDTKPTTPTQVVKNDTNLPPVPGIGLSETPSGPKLPDLKGENPKEVVKTPSNANEAADRLRAQQLVAEARRLQREGKLLDARKKAMEAQSLHVTFAADDVSPELVYSEINIEVRQKVDGLMKEAHNHVAYGRGDLDERYKKAEEQLKEAKSLASSFGQDTSSIEGKLDEIAERKQKTVAQGTNPPAPVGPNTTVSAPPKPPETSPEQQMLEKARLELRKGDTANARRLAEEVLRTAGAKNPALGEEASTVLRSVDVEEFNQKKLAANRTFDAALAAYRRREYSRASAMLTAIDVRLLDEYRQGRLREINLTPEMAPTQTRTVARNDGTPGTGSSGVVQTGGTGPVVPGTGSNDNTTGHASTANPGTNTPGKVRVTDSADGGLLDEHRQRQKVAFDMMRQKGLDIQKDAAEKFRTGQHEIALDMLKEYLAELSTSKLDASQVSLLRRPVESRLSHFNLLKAQKEMAAGVLASRQATTDRVVAHRKAEELKQKNVEKLMKDFNALFREGKYMEAESMASRALELDPDNGVASAAVYMARRQRNVTNYKKIKNGREEMNLESLNEAENEGPASAVTEKIAFDPERWHQATKRKALEPIKLGRPSDKQKMIERQLTTPVTISFENTPLRQVLNELRDVHGINIVEDQQALIEMGISLDSPISIKVERISLKSALNLVLRQAKLTWVIKDEVLQITSEDRAKDKLIPTSYAVADLVIPVENFGDIRNATRMDPIPTGGAMPNSTPTPVTGPNSMFNGQPVGTPTGGSMLNSPGMANMNSGNGGVNVAKRSANNTTEEQLIKLITSTIDPKSWAEMGGPGTIDYFPLTMSLVINQTPDIQEQIQDLLAALRRLQDQEVAVEVRFISVTEDFFERIGVNFSMNIPTSKYNKGVQPDLLAGTNVFDATRFINNFAPGKFLAGITPAGTLTPTLDIPITNSSFFQTVPSFGGYTAGGLGLGLAFLSDIQVFLFMEAVQGDLRANVMQAPKLTLFNGQTATLFVNDFQPFVLGVQLTNIGTGQFAVVPQSFNLPFGVNLTIQAVISADRRFVRLSLAPQMTNLVPGPVPTFPIVVPIFTSFDGQGNTGQPVVTFTQFVQQPITTSVSVQTTVAVPDGGTVLMGGLKRLSESRSEYGPPILSKLPWINRLFKNVGYGRETDSLLIMVTPRIIIQAEEEERQTGFTGTPAVAPQ